MPPDPATVLADRLRERRVELGLSQFDVYERCRIHWNTVSGYERAERTPSVRNLLRLADALETTAGELLDGIEPW